MRADDWIVDYLQKKGVTDVFGIPGVVVMDFLYAIDRRKPDIAPHLCFHEQGASFAACGYAQTTGKLGVAYSTRGPGFTNMITAMADAYYDSVPVMFITAHSSRELKNGMRVMDNQEIDTVALAKKITKRATRIDTIDELQNEVIAAFRCSTEGRKGPVFLDIYNKLFSEEVKELDDDSDTESTMDDRQFIATIEKELSSSKRPVILIGNGARGGSNASLLLEIAEKYRIPILSSRVSQDIIPKSNYYFGYVGSRATRYSNFVLSKSDLIISIGNRMSFPEKSASFSPVVNKAKIIRIDIDETEFIRKFPNSVFFKLSSESALTSILNANFSLDTQEWLDICNILRKKLNNYDNNYVISNIMTILEKAEEEYPVVCDVGNHSFWVSTAYAYQRASNRIMYSGSFGTLGSALPKSIGAYYSSRKPVICFTGDQGVQFNIQELQYIASHNLPISIVILNNYSSGMIMEREKDKYSDYLVHTTQDSGYSFPNFEKIAVCYGLDYIRISKDANCEMLLSDIFNNPTIIEIIIDQNTRLEPSLPVGKSCQDLFPELPRDLFEELNLL